MLAVSEGGEEEGGIESKQEGWAHNLKSNPHLRRAAKRTRYADLQYYQRVRVGEERQRGDRVRQVLRRRLLSVVVG